MASWFVPRGKYRWLVAGGWFVMREKYCWLVADKPSEQAADPLTPIENLISVCCNMKLEIESKIKGLHARGVGILHTVSFSSFP
jgi:hypothetical protein